MRIGCRKILDPDSYTAGGGGTATAPQTSSQPANSSATSVEVIDGELMISVSDNICWNRCRDKWIAWKGAEGMRKRAEERIRSDRRTADVLESDTIPWLERQLADARKDLADMQARRPAYPRADPPLNARIAQKEADIANLQTDIAQKRAEVARLRQEVEALQQNLPGLVRDEKAKLQAYLDCIHACATQARSAGDPSGFAEKTEENLRRQMLLLDTMLRDIAPPATRTSQAPRSDPAGSETRTARHDSVVRPRVSIDVMVGISASLGGRSDRRRHDDGEHDWESHGDGREFRQDSHAPDATAGYPWQGQQSGTPGQEQD